MNCIGNKVDLGCFGNCDAIATGLVATQSGVHYVVYRFSGQINTGSFEAVVDEEMIIPNMFNDYGASTFSIENPDGSLFVKTVDNEDYTNFQVRINPANNQVATVFAGVSDNPFTDAEKTKLEGLGAVTLFSDTEAFTGTYYGADPVYVRRIDFLKSEMDPANHWINTDFPKSIIKEIINLTATTFIVDTSVPFATFIITESVANINVTILDNLTNVRIYDNNPIANTNKRIRVDIYYTKN